MSTDQKYKEGYRKLKEIITKLVNPKREKAVLQPALQQQPYPYRQRFSRG